MGYRIAADTVLLLHVAFVLFVVFGGLLALSYRWGMWVHLPAAAWGIGIELIGGICPLTTVENTLRVAAGESGYPGGFVEHYIVPLLYPVGLTRETQYWLAAIALAVNLLIYGLVIFRRRRTADDR